MKKELKVIITIGLPASGKSEFAIKHIQKNENFVRISRDDFRGMLKNQTQCDIKIESLITDLCTDAMIKSLCRNENVIMDATHCSQKHINAIIEKAQDYADIEYMLFDVPVDKCIERDKLRKNPVGEDVIRKMNEKFVVLKDTFNFQHLKKHRNRPVLLPNFNSPLPEAVCFDIDGTLAHMVNRSPFEWNKVDHDIYSPIVGEQMEFHNSKGRTIIVLSGRDSSCRKLTEEWLEFYGLKYNFLLMRPENDFRKDSVIKKEFYETHIKDKYNLLCVYDDRLQVLDTWHKLGIFAFNVNQGNKLF